MLGLLAGLAVLPWAAAACPPGAEDGQALAAGELRLAWRTEPAALAVGRPFVLLLRACPADAQVTAVDATMPEHRHGMNYRPGLKALGDGRWRADGLLWHMSGRWELRIDVRRGDVLHSLRQDVVLR